MKRVYKNNKIKVIWQPNKCIHSANCIRGLPQVFDIDRTPWVDINVADAEEIMRVIDTCPSGALSYDILDRSESDNEQDDD